ncbi:GNAT family N-acetyltransferase [Parabacteroides sp. OttesenSCG-928-N08]|nr:GNAT family N-acetyltransferase [Parabacteroides sp. OttesenSCG-928-N08]
MKEREDIVSVAVGVDDAGWLQLVEKTYVDSFPADERRDFSLVCDLLRENASFRMYVLLVEEQYVGFITTWQFDAFDYWEHFAIDASARNKGLGGRALTAFLKESPRPVVLEVELPLDEMSRRRIGFYERLGFRLDDHEYIQPPYPGGSSLEMRLMTYGEIDLNVSYETVRQQIHREVYGVG